jgi:hypothetical protein
MVSLLNPLMLSLLNLFVPRVELALDSVTGSIRVSWDRYTTLYAISRVVRRSRALVCYLCHGSPK